MPLRDDLVVLISTRSLMSSHNVTWEQDTPIPSSAAYTSLPRHTWMAWFCRAILPSHPAHLVTAARVQTLGCQLLDHPSDDG